MGQAEGISDDAHDLFSCKVVYITKLFFFLKDFQ